MMSASVIDDTNAITFMYRFYTYVTLPEAFQDIGIIATPYPRIRAQLRNVGCPREIVNKCKRIFIVDVGHGCRVGYVV